MTKSYIAAASIGIEACAVAHYYSLRMGRKYGMLPQAILCLQGLRLLFLCQRDEDQRRKYRIIDTPFFRFYYHLSMYIVIPVTIAEIGRIAVEIAEIRGSLSLRNGQKMRQICSGVQALIGTGMTAYYIKEVEDKKVEKGVLTATTVFWILESLFENSSHCMPLRAGLGIGTSLCGTYVHGSSFGRKER